MEVKIDNFSNILSQYSEEKLLSRLFLACYKLKYSFAAWTLPGSNEKNIIIEFNHSVRNSKLNLEQNISGFAFGPFLNTDKENTLLIHSDFHYNLETKELNINDKLEKINDQEKLINELISNETSNSSAAYYTASNNNNFNSNKNHYLSIVNKAINAIKNNEFKKVVLARQKEIDLKSDFNPCKVFNTLCEVQFNSFVSLVYIPDTAFWIGASPELLISINKDQILKTTALAGTQRLNETEELSKAVWTQKEIEEQALVSRYIINCFKSIRLREFDEDGPKTVRAANLIHLKTDFSVNVNDVDFPNLGTTMLDLLHPTSAVCGMPKDITSSFIQNYEGIDRKFYSGFIGPVNIENETHIFVNIRCAEILNQKAILYSGAGITSESIPEKEFDETELKMKSLENILLNIE